MGDSDRWAAAWLQLTSAVENAYASGMTEQEIQDTVDEAKPSDEPHVGGGPKRKKS